MNRKDKKEVGQALNKSLLVSEIRQMIEETRSAVATAVNAGLTMLYWHIGKRIQEEILRGGRAEYGQEIVISLGRGLTSEFGRGFEEKNLRRMIQFAEAFPDEEIIAALRRQLSWTHFKILILLKILSNASSMLRCAESKGGARVHFRNVSILCFMSAPRFHVSRKK